MKAAKRTSYRRSSKTGAITSGRVEYKAIDPNQGDPRHNYARPVESQVGTVHGAAQPFLVPALVEQRSPFNRRLVGLEARLRSKVHR